MAVDMDRLHIAVQVCPPIGWADNMMHFQAVIVPEG